MRKQSLREQIYNAVIVDIVQGTFRANQIITENLLVDRFGCSKAPVREAFISLCHEGILQNLPRFGYQVVAFDQKDLASLRHLRIMTEPRYLADNWERIDADFLKRLKTLLPSEDELPITANIMEHWANNERIHLCIADFCDPIFASVLKDLLKKQTISYAQHYWSRWGQMTVQMRPDRHEELIYHMENNQKDAAIKTLIKDIQDYNEIIR